MKIGLEYEGVLFKKGKIIRFESLSEKDKALVEKYYKSPHDAYDCLAECRTEPFMFDKKTDARDIAYNLFMQQTMLHTIYKSIGVDVSWREHQIPAEIHRQLVDDTLNFECKNGKVINTFSDQGITEFMPRHDEKIAFRGGGIHLNVSDIDEKYYTNIILNLYREYCFYKDTSYKSFYRNNCLFRLKNEAINGFNGIEFMSIGLSIPEEVTFEKYFNFTRHFFHLFDPIVKELKKYI